MGSGREQVCLEGGGREDREDLWTWVGFALSDLEPEDNRVESGRLKGSLAQERAGLKESRNIARGICR